LTGVTEHSLESRIDTYTHGWFFLFSEVETQSALGVLFGQYLFFHVELVESQCNICTMKISEEEA
jgi:hypothetical protein